MNNLLHFPDRNPRPWMSLLQEMGTLPAGLHHLESRGSPRFASRLLERLDHMSTRFAHAPATPAHPGPVRPSPSPPASATRHHFLSPATPAPAQPDVTRWLQDMVENRKNRPSRLPGPGSILPKNPAKTPADTLDLSGISLLRPRRH